eukprot:scaffold2908_cov62-Phaeocystis_antarctica.AAC.3
MLASLSLRLRLRLRLRLHLRPSTKPPQVSSGLHSGLHLILWLHLLGGQRVAQRPQPQPRASRALGARRPRARRAGRGLRRPGPVVGPRRLGAGSRHDGARAAARTPRGRGRGARAASRRGRRRVHLRALFAGHRRRCRRRASRHRVRGGGRRLGTWSDRARAPRRHAEHGAGVIRVVAGSSAA